MNVCLGNADLFRNFHQWLQPTKRICAARDLSLVRPLLMLKSTTKLEFVRNDSQRTGSVAKIAGGSVLVQPIAEAKQHENAEFTSVSPKLRKYTVSSCIF